jgi:hypothetical protein
MTTRPLSKHLIKKHLLPSKPDSLPEKFVSAIVKVDKSGTINHAGIAVGSEEGQHMFHFNSTSLIKRELKYYDNYYQREFETIPPYLADAFYVHCMEAMDSCAPEYGKFYNGTYFKDGKVINPDEEAPFLMSCVGFCLGVLNGWDTAENYIEHEDWTANNSLTEAELRYEQSNLKQLYGGYLSNEELLVNIRRIKPSEYLASAYLAPTPISKASIEPIATILENIALKLKEVP